MSERDDGSVGLECRKVEGGERFMSERLRKVVTILTPCFNEEASISECYQRLRSVMDSESDRYDVEFLFIDNCSVDNTVDVLRKIAASDRRVKVIVNSRNFGQSKSPFYGILQSSGDALITMVADLQTPPELIPELLRKWERGSPIVVAVRTAASEGRLVRFARSLFYYWIKKISMVEQIPNFVGFGLFDKRILEILRDFDDPTPYFRGMISEIGFEKSVVEYVQPLRKHGKSRHTLFDLIDYAVLGFVNYSQVPLRLMTVVGFLASLISFLVMIVFIVVKVIWWNQIPMGVAPILVCMCFFASLQFLFLGILGEYVGAIHERLKRRPLVIEKERINFD